LSRFWLYLGILLVCSGVGTAFGVILIVIYFWDDIKKTINQNCQQQQNISEIPEDPRYYDDDTVESMR
jgi:Na+-transporting methylmalonyl-CoA/oxaloacetate decarboxylase gamma subunit